MGLGYHRKLSGTVGTTATAFAHGLGTIPEWTLFIATGTVAGVLRRTALDQTNLTLVSTLANTTFEAYVGVFD